MKAELLRSNGENMSDIPALTAEVDRLSRAVGFWNTVIIIMMVCVALVATGLVIAQQMAFRRAAALVEATDHLSTLKEGVANQKIADAGERSAAANERAGNAERGAADAQKGTAIAQAEAATANERAAELEKENLVLQQKLANRRITKAQHDLLVDSLSKHRGTVIIETMVDSESGLYAADFLKTFTDSGWHIGGKNFPLGIVWIGLIVYRSPDPDALTIAQALKVAGIPFSIGTESRSKATIMIGGKPPIF